VRLASVSVAIVLSVAGCTKAANDPDPNLPPVDPATGMRVAELGPVPPLPTWADNPDSDAKKALGKAIFFDPRFSGSGTGSCGAGCHLSLSSFQSSLPLDVPDRSYPALAPTLPRHTPSLLNVVYAPMMRWDGSYFTNLFEMCVFPLAEANMNLSHSLPASEVDAIDLPGAQAVLLAKVANIAGYRAAFQDVFGVDVSALAATDVWTLAGKAVATYLRVAVSRDAAFDAWNAGDASAMSASAAGGLAVFRGKGKCVACHGGPLFSDFQFHNVSTSLPDASGNRPDEGRFLVTGLQSDRGRFLTPTLRSSALTSPYLHDGSRTSLADVIHTMTGSQALLDPNHDAALDGSVALTDDEVSDLVEFIKALNGAPITQADLAVPSSFP
jgi:cytochrome c peroxidase